MKPIYTTCLLIGMTSCLLLGCETPPKAEQAKEGYRTIPAQIGRDTDQAKRLTAKAAIAMDQDKLDEAERLLRDALTADVMHGPAHNNLGQLYYHQKRYYEAAWEFQYAIRLMPHQPIPRNNLGLVFEATGQLDEAVEQYELAVSEEPDNAVLLGNLARARVRRGDAFAGDPNFRGELRGILRQIVMKDTRPEWRTWAEEQLNRVKEK